MPWPADVDRDTPHNTSESVVIWCDNSPLWCGVTSTLFFVHNPIIWLKSLVSRYLIKTPANIVAQGKDFVRKQANSGLVLITSKGCRQKKTNSIFKDIVQKGGREFNPISNKWKEKVFWQKFEREGVTKHIAKNRSTLFCMIYYSIWPNQGTLCLSVWPLTLRK